MINDPLPRCRHLLRFKEQTSLEFHIPLNSVILVMTSSLLVPFSLGSLPICLDLDLDPHHQSLPKDLLH